MAKRRSKLAQNVEAFRDKAESFIALAKQVEKMPKSRQRDAIVRDAHQTLLVVRSVMQQADDVRNWAREVFGVGADSHPLAEFASRALTHSLNSTMGFQTYRMKNFLTGKRVAYSPHPAGVAVIAAIGNIAREH